MTALACLECGSTKTPIERWLCHTCYERRRRNGREMPPKMKPTALDRLLASQGPPDACWPWSGSVNPRGYGYFDGKEKLSAHRFAYTHWVGPIPDGLEIEHRCHTEDANCFAGDACPHRRCVNPLHLTTITGDENKRNAHRVRKTHCPAGHPYSGDNLAWSRTGKGRIQQVCIACRRAFGRAKEERKRRAAGIAPRGG